MIAFSVLCVILLEVGAVLVFVALAGPKEDPHPGPLFMEDREDITRQIETAGYRR